MSISTRRSQGQGVFSRLGGLAGLVALFVLLGSAPAQAQEGQLLAPPPGQMLAPPPPVESPHALAIRARWVTVPSWSLDAFLAAHTQLNDGWGVGIEYLYRRAGFDVVVSLDYSWLNPASGNYLGKSNAPDTDTHFLVFDNLSSLSLDVSLIGHWNITSWLEFRLGAGLGIGGVFGNLYQITNNSNCTADNAGDPSHCYPSNVGPIATNGGKIDDSTRQRLQNQGCTADFTDNGMDNNLHPCFRRVDTYPMSVRVVPVLNTMLGLRFRLQRHLYVHLDAGWRLVGFYLGAGPEFRF